MVSIRVDKIYDKKVVWDRGFTDRDSEPYQTLAYEANRAVSEFNLKSAEQYNIKRLTFFCFFMYIYRSNLLCR